jgi:hypothetical protein
VGGESSLLLDREIAVSSDLSLRCPGSNHLSSCIESVLRCSALSCGLASGLSTGYPEKFLALLCRLWKSIFPPAETREKITRPRQSSKRMDCTIDMRFWKMTSSARMLSLVLMARISRRDSSRWLSREMTVDCQISSYCCLKLRSSSKTVLLSVSRKVLVFCSCFFSTLEKASRRILDCCSMYPSESVELVSKSWSRLETALKKLS